MRLKSYFAETVESAIHLARQELGPDAMLMNSKRTSPEARYLGEYEVVCALMPATPASTASAHFASSNIQSALAATTPAASAPAATAPVARVPQPVVTIHASEMLDRLWREVSELKQHLERMAAMLSRSNSLASPGVRGSPELADIFADLIACELDDQLAEDVLRAIDPNGGPGPAQQEALHKALASLFTVDSSLGRSRGRRVAAFIGPPGSGKTTTLVKLAARYGLGAGQPALVLSIDNTRIAAAAQLRAYAAILGIGFQCVDTTAELAQAIVQHEQEDLVLIDTPGYSSRDLDGAGELARFFSSRPDIDTHLVLTASTRGSDLARVADGFRMFDWKKLLFTRTDETRSFGAIVNESARTRKPISFLANGQEVPEDIAPASANSIVESLLHRIPAGTAWSAAAAA